MSSLKRSIEIIFRLTITIAPIIWLIIFLQGVDLRDVEAYIKQASPGYFVLVLLVIALSVILKALRWQIILLLTMNRSFLEAIRLTLRLAAIILRS